MFRRTMPWLIVLVLLGNMSRAAESAKVDRTFLFEPSPVEAELPTAFQLERGSLVATEIKVDPTLERVTFPSPVVSGHAANDIVHAEFYPPANDTMAKPARAVIFLHYLDGNLVLPRLFCRMLSQKGVASLLVKMPYYHERRERTERRMLSPDVALTTAAVRQAALDVRYARAYLASRDDIDPQHIGIAGISLGGIVGSLAFQLEPRLERGCFLLAGADIATMLWQSKLTAKLRTQWETEGITKDALAKSFSLVDPASYAGRRAGRPVLLLSGRGDDTVPEACTQALAHALDQPETIWFEGGHSPAVNDVAGAMLHVLKFFADAPERPSFKTNP